MIIPVFGEDAAGVALRVIILAVFQRPEECGQPDRAQKQRHRNKDAQDRHFSRSAFSDTVIDDSDMASAAASGVASPTSAIGTATIL